MTTHLTSKQLISQNENSEAHPKKAVVDGTRNKISKTTTKKGGTGLGKRRALNDITNKSTVHHEASIRKKNSPKEEFIHADEKNLHDHKKCIEAHQQNALEPNFLEIVFPGHDFASHPQKPINKAKSDIDKMGCYPELVELPMPEFCDWLEPSRNSFSSSPIHWDSPPSSPLACHFAPVDFLLKQEEAVVDGRNKFSKTTAKKGGGGLGNRKALEDITNKFAINHEAATAIKNLPKEEFKYADEKFLHDHKKCVEAQQKALEPNFLETVFPGGLDFVSRPQKPLDKAKSDSDNVCCFSEPVELPMLEFCDWLKPLPNSDSSSPIRWDSPPSSPHGWRFALAEFLLKPEIDD